MMKSLNKALFLVSGTVTLLLGSFQVQAIAGEECRELIQKKCASCHFVKYICPKIEQGKGTFSWRWSINAMVKEGLVATDQEQDQLVSCLVNPDAKVKAFCPSKK
jgi:hypothetical protein